MNKMIKLLNYCMYPENSYCILQFVMAFRRKENCEELSDKNVLSVHCVHYENIFLIILRWSPSIETVYHCRLH